MNGIQLSEFCAGLYRITLDYRIHYKYNGWASLGNTRWEWSINSNQISFHSTDWTWTHKSFYAGWNSAIIMIIALHDMDMELSPY